MSSTVEQLRALDALATEQLLEAGGAGMGIRRKVLAGSSGEGRVVSKTRSLDLTSTRSNK
jgi:hypothetical protein